ncbi:hypothetical protein PGTUg99_001522 [Puccinia graminis f. sp. tritici]|nr:hypothetical protein PGTUg99_004034 [Puccinia graminis f. sp. tritici]KAA1125122.1 hypothetical protein PGTUg99_001522 [Puccinia graminis f. sp. tritici]
MFTDKIYRAAHGVGQFYEAALPGQLTIPPQDDCQIYSIASFINKNLMYTFIFWEAVPFICSSMKLGWAAQESSDLFPISHFLKLMNQ